MDELQHWERNQGDIIKTIDIPVNIEIMIPAKQQNGKFTYYVLKNLPIEFGRLKGIKLKFVFEVAEEEKSVTIPIEVKESASGSLLFWDIISGV